MRAHDQGSRGRWRTSALLFLGLFLIYSANGREIGAVDTVGNVLLPIALLRGDGLVLNRFSSTVRGEYWVKERGSDLISRYPVLPALVALPATWPQVALLDRVLPGWTSDSMVYHWWLRTIAKNAAAIVGALTGALLYLLLLRLGLEGVALPTTLATALGSNLWVVASQSPWLHGTVALFLTLSLVLLVPTPASRWRLAAAGLAIAAAVCARPTSAVFALPLAAWALGALGRRALYFLVPAAAVGVLLLAHNWSLFQNLTGGMGEIEAMGHAKHGVAGVVTREPFVSTAGTLLSPSRGLFVYSPWVLLALAALPWTLLQIRTFPPLAAALLGLAPFALMNAAYSVWWGGWSFGPRYWTEAMPLFGVLLGFALRWARARSYALLALFGAAIAGAVALQAIGAFYYPSSWNEAPVTVDLAHERLWDWRDTEISRSLAEGPHWPASYELLARWLRDGPDPRGAQRGW
jgi:hypothetical protein